MHRVVVTSMGAVTAHGTGVARLWQGIVAGSVAIRPVRSVDLTGHRTRLGGEVDWDGGDDATCDAATDFALTAAREAMVDSGITIAATRWGVVLGTCNAGLRSAEHAWRAQHAGESPDWRRFLLIQPQILAEAVAAEFGIKGPVLAVNSACASAAHAIGHAVDMIRSNQADAMLVGGADAFTETAFAGFNSLESLSSEPAAPYSKHRQGLSLGEGAGMLVLARLDVARAAGAPILAEVLGYGLSADGYHPTAPHPQGEGAARAITAALADAGVAPSGVDYLNGHGTGTPKNDTAESNAVRAALGDSAETTPLSSIKSMIGHLLGAAGAVEGIATVLAVQHQTAPPTANFTEPDPDCGLDPVPGSARPMRIRVALSNSFAFAGTNATVAFGAYVPTAASPGNPSEDIVITGVGNLHHGENLCVDVDVTRVLPARQARRLDRLSLLAIAAGREALAHAQLDIDDNCERVGVVFGTGLGPIESIEKFTVPVLVDGPRAANPAVFPNTVYNAAAGQVAMHLGTRGPSSTIPASHAAGAAAMCVAFDMLRAGRADALVCVGADVPSDLTKRVYAQMPLFRAGRLSLSEGAVALVLERRSVAEARGAPILATMVGRAIASDAVGIGRWDSGGDGVERAMRSALTEAGAQPGDLRAIWANSVGVAVVDRPEDRAIGRLLDGMGVAVHRPRLGRAEPGGVGALLSAALAMQSGDGGLVLINSSSLGGTHVCVALERTPR